MTGIDGEHAKGWHTHMMESPMMEVLGRRLDRLERQNRRLRVMAWSASVAVLVFMAIGLAPKTANTAETAQKSIVAHAISIVDAQGNPRIVLGMDPATGPVVTILNKKGDPAATMGTVDKDGSSAIRLSDKNDKGGASIFNTADGTSGMILDDKGGVTRATIGVGPDGTPVVSLNSKDEKVTAAMAVVDEATPRISLEDKDGNAKTIEPGK